MEEVTFALSILLIAGFVTAKLGQLIHLPSVTGYIFAGLILGPTGFNFVSEDAIGDKLDHFTSIALMLIAFGIGEHLELKRLKKILKNIGIIGIGETTGAFLLVFISSFFIVKYTGIGEAYWTTTNFIILALLLAAVSVATAPAATLHVMRELKASGPLTTTLMAVVAVDDGLAIMFFGISVSMAHHILGTHGSSFLASISGGLIEIVLSLGLGVVTGLVLDFAVKKMKSQPERLTVGLALLLLCGETARLLHYSPLLAGMAAGFTIINRDRRDVRIFKALNMFEPPIYVLFFTLAGTQLHLSALYAAGFLGISYFFARGIGKISGAYIGSLVAGAPKVVQKFLGIALVPQAGVAIGLIFLIRNDKALSSYSSIITPVVLAGVVISELIGPLCAKFAFIKANEAKIEEPDSREIEEIENGNNISIATWKDEKITNEECSFSEEAETIVFGISEPETAAFLGRIASLVANHYCAVPLATYVISDDSEENILNEYLMIHRLFSLIREEVDILGSDFKVETVHSEKVSKGLIESAVNNSSKCIVIGYPSAKRLMEYKNVMETIVESTYCPVITVRCSGKLDTQNTIIPITKIEELSYVQTMIQSFAVIANHSLTIQYLMPPNQTDEIIKETENEILTWIKSRKLNSNISYNIKSSESYLEAIVEESAEYDLILMSASDNLGFQRIFFGSLEEEVAKSTNKTMVVVYNPRISM